MIELTSNKYVDKQEIANAFSNLSKATTDAKREEYLVEIQGLLSAKEEVTLEFEEEALLSALWEQEDDNESIKYVLENADNDWFVEYLEEQGYDVNLDKKPLNAVDLNNFDLKRKLCDFFETSYQIDSFELLKLIAVRLEDKLIPSL